MHKTSVSRWRQIQRNNFTDWQELLTFLQLDDRPKPIQNLGICQGGSPNFLANASAGREIWDKADAGKNQILNGFGSKVELQNNPSFGLNIPRRLAEKIQRNTWEDPILKQFLPSRSLPIKNPLFIVDPVEDTSFRKAPKLLHKYKGRALLLCSGACAMHCRYCFRQNFDYAITDKQFTEELAYIAQDETLTEIILSGGDPLSLSDAVLSRLLKALERIPHLKRIRFHTRFPMGIPERIDRALLDILKACTKQIFFVIHCNHAHEFDEEIFKRLKKIQMLGIPVLSQSVLLKDINDDLPSLKNLFTLLVNRGIIPYYLHQLDRVRGAEQYEVPEEKGKLLMKQLAAELSGYALPKYAKEIAHFPNKTVIL